jgi:multimeric flavodoxin WrbA
MSKAVAVNGSPRSEKGYTAMVLARFIQGMTDANFDVELFGAARLDIKPCGCGEMYCWYKKPGECCIKDDMELLYPKLREAHTLVLATPVYIPLPGQMQDFLNRLCPLMNPVLETREGRTRGRLREDVQIKRIVLVSTGGWWEKENFGTVVRIAQELAEDASVEFAGAVLRPHAFLMTQAGELTEDGEAVLDMARQAGYELGKDGVMNAETLEAISRPLITEDELRRRFNQMV